MNKYYTYEPESWNDKSQVGMTSALITDLTPYAESNGVVRKVITEEVYNGGENNTGLKEFGYGRDMIGLESGWWWLRTPCNRGSECIVSLYGAAGWGMGKELTKDGYGVCPALYIDPTVVAEISD